MLSDRHGTRPLWPPKIINLISAGIFLVLILIGFLGNRSIDGWHFDWARVWSPSRLACCSS